MIRIGIFDISELHPTEDFLEELPKGEIDRLNSIKNERKRKERLASRILLYRLYHMFFGEKTPEICYTGYGMPYFKDEKVKFSVSYSGNVVAVCITDGENVGLDIEMLKNGGRVARVSERFLKKTKELLKTPLDFSEFRPILFEKELEESKTSLKVSDGNCEFNERLSDWCALEAVLKLCGKGFAGFDDVNDYLQNVRVKASFFSHGCEEYCIALAMNK